MVQFIYINESVNLGIGSGSIDVRNRVVEKEELELRIKFSTRIEDFHVFAFGSGKFIVTDLDLNNFIVSPSSGIVEVYHLLEFLTSSLSEYNYCVEEFYTIDQYDDEFCIEIKRSIISGEEKVELKNNKQSSGCVYNEKQFIEEICNFSDKLMRAYIEWNPNFKSSPIFIEIIGKVQLLRERI